jgi:hypothetical protein
MVRFAALTSTLAAAPLFRRRLRSNEPVGLCGAHTPASSPQSRFSDLPLGPYRAVEA